MSHPISVKSNVTLRFAPLAAGPNFGSSDSMGWLKNQSEMTLNGMSSDPNNAVKQFVSDFNETDLHLTSFYIHNSDCPLSQNLGGVPRQC